MFVCALAFLLLLPVALLPLILDGSAGELTEMGISLDSTPAGDPVQMV